MDVYFSLVGPSNLLAWTWETCQARQNSGQILLRIRQLPTLLDGSSRRIVVVCLALNVC